MRVIGVIPHPACKITLFDWNQKFLVKLEQGPCEQTFKLSQLDLPDEASLRAHVTPEFIERALARFGEMFADVRLLTDGPTEDAR